MLNTSLADTDQSSPNAGLFVDLLYLRPTHRPPLLRLLAELGVFVHEHHGLPLGGSRNPFDGELIVAFADLSTESLQAVTELVSTGHLVVAVTESGDGANALSEAGAFATLSESATVDATRETLALASRAARAGGTGRRYEGVSVFGSLFFRSMSSELAHGRTVTILSPVELEVLRSLVRHLGDLVPKEVLQSRLRKNGEDVSEGYLKTVILRIRRKAELLGGDPAALAAVRGIGYVLRG